ncbi:MAG: hypothetical protein ORN56_06430 [Chitinophagales bacterium]|nr:hypothetical protein [Chitinophagales bacterium]
MKKNMLKKLLLALITCISVNAFATNTPNNPLSWSLNADNSHYVKVNATGQFWLRHTDMNPGSTYNGYAKDKGLDIGIRRFRVQFQSQLSDRVFMYAQLGLNNFHSYSDRQTGFYVMDACSDYEVIKDKLALGGGLSSWVGFSRFSSPAVASIMGVDAPLQFQTTNDVTDQFIRRLGLYAKGYLGKLNYRLAMVQPFDIQKSPIASSVTISKKSSFSPLPPKMQWNAYLNYEFKDKEQNKTPYFAGTYLGAKKVSSLGAGITYQPNAMWALNNNSDTVFHALLFASIDYFYDAPVGHKGAAISYYANVAYTDFGHNYLRMLGAMNPMTGSKDLTILNGGGNRFPAYGTGTSYYMQLGYKLSQKIAKLNFMPYASMQRSYYTALKVPMNFFEAGMNILLDGHNSKLTVGYQDRPVFKNTGELITRKGSLILQLQTAL